MQEFEIPKTPANLYKFVQQIFRGKGPLVNGTKDSRGESVMDVLSILKDYELLRSPAVGRAKFQAKYTLYDQASEMFEKLGDALNNLSTDLKMTAKKDRDLPIGSIGECVADLRDSMKLMDPFEALVREQREASVQQRNSFQATRNDPSTKKFDAETRAAAMEFINDEVRKHNQEHPDHPRDAIQESEPFRNVDTGSFVLALAADIKRADDLLLKIENTKALLNGIAHRAEAIGKTFDKERLPKKPDVPPMP